MPLIGVVQRRLIYFGATPAATTVFVVAFASVMESGNSKADQVFGAMSNGVCKVFNAIPTSLLVGVLAETTKQMKIVQQCHFKDDADFIISSSRECEMSAVHSAQALPASEMHSDDLMIGVEIAKFNKGIGHAECILPLDPDVVFREQGVPHISVAKRKQGEFFSFLRRNPLANLFLVMIGGTVMVNCIWDLGISFKTMNRSGLTETIVTHLLLWSTDVTSPISHYFYNHLEMNTQSKEEKQRTSRGIFIFPYLWLSLALETWHILLYFLFPHVLFKSSMTLKQPQGIVTCKWGNVVHPQGIVTCTWGKTLGLLDGSNHMENPK
ncbi:hypothetical protein RND71_042047 [Anisodus tanguticus]|uniref:Uncharacterized protein n=1 Tax=Anisodus tanguticus TaxID=243964 RepID=A0AAE1QQ78_9SOLA|nr:hypothetical protein RND71_042047 [Anisodus tanguticus]